MDQASKLRNAIVNKNSQDYENNKARVICVSSGKGGVGKSNLTLNLAISLTKKNKKVLVIDADLGLANIEVLMGLNPKYSLIDVIERNISLSDALIRSPIGVDLISGGAGFGDLANLSAYKINSILNNLAVLEDDYDYIFMDTGAGISQSVLSFISSSDEVIVVTIPEPTAIADAYALVKVIQTDAPRKINMIVNRVDNDIEGNRTFNKINVVSQRFLHTNISYLGHVTDDKNVRSAVKLQRPFSISYPNTIASKDLEVICSRISNLKPKKDKESFISKLGSILFNRRK